MQTALRWLREAAAALDTADDAGVVHRDIKPGNLLLDEHERLAVADFGIARLAWEDQLTATGQVLGTAAYLSPEQAMGEAATAASDRYALAVVAYELLTGSRPFEAEHFAAQARAHVEDPPPPASSRAPELSRAVDAVLERGLAKEPGDRWPSAARVRRRARADASRRERHRRPSRRGGCAVRRRRRPPRATARRRRRAARPTPAAARRSGAPLLARPRRARAARGGRRDRARQPRRDGGEPRAQRRRSRRRGDRARDARRRPRPRSRPRRPTEAPTPTPTPRRPTETATAGAAERRARPRRRAGGSSSRASTRAEQVTSRPRWPRPREAQQACGELPRS